MSAIDYDLLDPKNWIGVKELAGILGIRTQSIYNLHAEGGDLPPIHKKGRCVRFFRPEVEAWLISGRRLTASARLMQRALSEARP